MDDVRSSYIRAGRRRGAGGGGEEPISGGAGDAVLGGGGDGVTVLRIFVIKDTATTEIYTLSLHEALTI